MASKLLSLGAVDVAPEKAAVDIVDDMTHIVDVKRFDPLRPDSAITDDIIREIDWNGDVLFEWHARDHFIPAGPGDLGHGLYGDEASKYALNLGFNSEDPGNRWDNTGFVSKASLKFKARSWKASPFSF